MLDGADSANRINFVPSQIGALHNALRENFLKVTNDEIKFVC